MKRNNLHLIIAFVLILFTYQSYSQSSTFPDINLNVSDTVYKVPVKKIYKTLSSYKIQPSLDEQTEVMNEILSGNYIPEDFITVATKFKKRYNKLMYEQFVRNLEKNSVDSTSDDYIKQSAAVNVIDTSHDVIYNIGNTVYQFMCYDFDGDGKPDMMTFPKGYFGPSLGISFYARINGKLQYMIDNSGQIVEVKDSKDRIMIRFMVTIIDVSETNIIYNLVYDKKTHNAFIDSKLYYAQQLVHPKITDAPESFKTTDSVYLRYSPMINDSANKEGYFYRPYFSTMLFGNVEAVYPKDAKGNVLYKDKDWAFVAFNPESVFIRSSLQHGMDNEQFYKEHKYIRPYLFGWIPVNKIRKLD